jgi:cell division protein FtsQ
MAIKVNISSIFFVSLWCLAGSGVLVLLIAAIKYRNNNTCKGYRIDIAGSAGELFIDKAEIEDLLALSGATNVKDINTRNTWKGRPIQSFDLRRMESGLERNVWIKKAQLFFDDNGLLRVNVIARVPVVRIFSRDGNSFYIDSSGTQLPLSEKGPVRLPVFTNYPAAKIHLHGEDSVLTAQIRTLGAFIGKDPFWMAQIDQVDITAGKTFELVPTIGNHLIELGDGSDYEQKFHRLFVFYKEVLSRTGFDKYSRIDIAYAGQVIGTKKGSEGTRFDSIQGMNNIRQMIRTAQQLQPDTVRQQNIRPLERNTQTEQTLVNYDLIPDDGERGPAPSGVKGHSNPVTIKPARKTAVGPDPNSMKTGPGNMKRGQNNMKPDQNNMKKNPKALMPQRQ